MNVSVSRKSTLLTVLGLAAAVAVYLFVPPVHHAIGEVARILLTADAREAILGFRTYLLGFGAWAAAVSAASRQDACAPRLRLYPRWRHWRYRLIAS